MVEKQPSSSDSQQPNRTRYHMMESPDESNSVSEEYWGQPVNHEQVVENEEKSPHQSGSGHVAVRGALLDSLEKMKKFFHGKRPPPIHLFDSSDDDSDSDGINELYEILGIRGPTGHYDHLEIRYSPRDGMPITILWSINGDSHQVSFIGFEGRGYTTATTVNGKMEYGGEMKQGDVLTAALLCFMGPILNPNNTFARMRVNLLGHLKAEESGNETSQRILTIIKQTLSQMYHLVAVQHLSMAFEHYEELIAIVEHLNPKTLKKMTFESTTCLPNTAQNERKLDELMELKQVKQAKELVARNIPVPLEKSRHFTDLLCRTDTLHKTVFDYIIENFLKLEGWASRVFYAPWMQGTLFELLEDVTRREFNASWEDVEEDHGNGVFSITVGSGLHQCSIIYRKDGQLQKCRFENRKLMLWPSALERPDVVTEDMVYEKLQIQQNEMKLNNQKKLEMMRARIQKIEQELEETSISSDNNTQVSQVREDQSEQHTDESNQSDRGSQSSYQHDQHRDVEESTDQSNRYQFYNDQSRDGYQSNRSSQPNHQDHDSYRRGSWTSYQDTRRDDQPPYQEDQWQQLSSHQQNNRIRQMLIDGQSSSQRRDYRDSRVSYQSGYQSDQRHSNIGFNRYDAPRNGRRSPLQSPPRAPLSSWPEERRHQTDPAAARDDHRRSDYPRRENHYGSADRNGRQDLQGNRHGSRSNRAPTYWRSDCHMGLSLKEFLELKNHYNKFHRGSSQRCPYQNEGPSNQNYLSYRSDNRSASGQYQDRRHSSYTGTSSAMRSYQNDRDYRDQRRY